jgi:hypothetical protein
MTVGRRSDGQIVWRICHQRESPKQPGQGSWYVEPAGSRCSRRSSCRLWLSGTRESEVGVCCCCCGILQLIASSSGYRTFPLLLSSALARNRNLCRPGQRLRHKIVSRSASPENSDPHKRSLDGPMSQAPASNSEKTRRYATAWAESGVQLKLGPINHDNS